MTPFEEWMVNRCPLSGAIIDRAVDDALRKCYEDATERAAKIAEVYQKVLEPGANAMGRDIAAHIRNQEPT